MALSNRTIAGPLPGAPIPGAARLQFESVDIANMIMTTTFSHRLSPLILACAAALLSFGCGSPVHGQTVAVMVNGEPITNYDIEQRGKLTFLTTHKPADRKEVISELIDEKVKIKEGKKFGVDPSASDIDQSYAAMSSRMRITPEQLTKSLESQGIRADTLRARIKAEMVWTSLIRGRYKESLQVGEKDVAAAVQVNGGDKQEPDAFEHLFVGHRSLQRHLGFQRQRKGGQERLGGRINRSKGNRLKTSHGRDRYDASLLLLDHLRQQTMRELNYGGVL